MVSCLSEILLSCLSEIIGSEDINKCLNFGFTVDQVIDFSVLTLNIIFFQLMMLVDYAGSIFPVIAHAPWNGVHLADFVMPFFLFVAGVSVAIVYKVTLYV